MSEQNLFSSSARKSMTNADLQAAHNLKVIWANFKVDHLRRTGKSMTQKKAAALMDWSQSNFSQYLNGLVPIGQKAARVMADTFGCAPGDIRPDTTDAQVVEESERLKEILGEVLSVLQKVRNGEADNQNIDIVLKSIESRAPNLTCLTG